MQRGSLVALLFGFLWILSACEGIDATKESLNQPRNLKSSTADDSITISWTKVTRASQYTVYLSDNPDFQVSSSTNFDDLFEELLSGNTSGAIEEAANTVTFVQRTATTPDEHYTFTDLKTDAEYYFRVTATVDGVVGPPSEVGKVVLGTPEAPDPDDSEDSMITERQNAPDAFSFTKLNHLGREVPFLSDDYQCVRDNTAQLVWAAKSNAADLHNRDDLYHWQDDNPNSNGSDSGKSPSIGLRCHLFSGQVTGQCSTQDYINRMNAAKVCGFDDWRLPRPMELLGLMNFDTTAQTGPTVPVEPRFFPQLKPGAYWTDTPNAPNNDIDRAHVVVFEENAFSTAHRTNQANNGIEMLRVGNKDVGLSVLLVRGDKPNEKAEYLGNCRQDIVANSPNSRFILNDDGTATDRYSGLQWSRCLGSSAFASNACSGGDNTAGKEPDSLHGQLGWRLPTLKELYSVIELSCAGPAMNSDVFLSAAAGTIGGTVLKSATAFDGRDCQNADDCDAAYGIDMQTGDVMGYNRNNAEQFPAFMVRDSR